MDFCERWSFWALGCSGGLFVARALSGFKEDDHFLSCGCLAIWRLWLWYGRSVVHFACVCGASEMLCVRIAQLHGDQLLSVVVPPELDGRSLLLVARDGWVPLDADLESLVFPRNAVPIGVLTCGSHPRGGACGWFELELHLYLGKHGKLRV